MKDPTDEMKLYAVKMGSLIQYIKNPTEEMKLEAIRNEPHVLKWITNPTEEMYRLVEESRLYFDITDIPKDRWTDKLIDSSLFFHTNRLIILKWSGLTPEWEMKIAQFGDCNKTCSDDILRIAIRVNPCLIRQYNGSMHEKLIQMNPKCLSQLNDNEQSLELCRLAVSLDIDTLFMVRNDEHFRQLKDEFR